MKKSILLLTFILSVYFIAQAQEESAYFEVGKLSKSINEVGALVKTSLETAGFEVIGEYQPGGSGNLAVICYTSNKLQKIALDYTDRGALAATLKIGLKKENGIVKVSMLNPMYLFYAYFVTGVEKHENELKAISEKAKSALKNVGTDFTAFGGTLDKKKLQKYHYKIMMPYFADAEELNSFDSFEAGVKTIEANLATGKANTSKVYQLVFADKKVAVFGVALNNPDNGEAHFLPIIGDDHVAAMPYEIILQNNTASILPGKYRIALHWPELTMGTFMKIMSTPGDIKDTLEKLTK